MEFTIGPYKLSRRTEYSKFRIFDIRQNKYIEDEELSDKILADFTKQKKYAAKYFKIEDDVLVGIDNGFIFEDIKFLFIPEGISVIGMDALANSSFEYVSFPSTLSGIEGGAFCNNQSLKEITIPDTVSEISRSAFENCTSLHTAKIPNIESISKELFKNCISLKNIEIPDGVKFISASSFAYCTSLKKIKLPKSLKGIGPNAFESCNNLENISFPEFLEAINENAFKNCIKLKEAIIPDTVTRIGSRAFMNCALLENVKLSRGTRILYERTFEGCSCLKNLVLPDTILSLGAYVFKGASSLKNINIPKEFYTIDTLSPFAYSNLKSLTFNHSLESMDLCAQDLISYSEINKLIIDKNCKIITPKAFEDRPERITSIDYLGSEEEFEFFKKHNKRLFNKLKNISKINFLEKYPPSQDKDEPSR